VYTGARWKVDENDALITERAKDVAKNLLRLTLGDELDSEERKKLFGWALHSEQSGAIAAMVKLARGIPGVIVEHEELDADPYLLNVANGTIDLRTGGLLAHDPKDLCTKFVPVDYDPDARSELWDRCLEGWQPDPDMRAYLQLEAGAAATGKHTETLSVHFGTGGNGKSKFWGAVQHVLGDYTVEPHKSLLVAGRFEQHETVKADLFRVRLALAAESKAADVLDDEQVKSITGNDRLRARRMREDRRSFWPTHTLIMFSNYRPRIQGRGEDVWRRLRLVPWEITIPEAERDPDLLDKIRGEAPAVLAWMVAGARRFHAGGFTPPEAVRVATAAYRTDEDHLGRFVTECLAFEDGAVRSADVVEALKTWCAEHGIPPISIADLAETFALHD
jgi:putative DNA primase/helicase